MVAGWQLSCIQLYEAEQSFLKFAERSDDEYLEFMDRAYQG